jgi:hypothetical protein
MYNNNNTCSFLSSFGTSFRCKLVLSGIEADHMSATVTDQRQEAELRKLGGQGSRTGQTAPSPSAAVVANIRTNKRPKYQGHTQYRSVFFASSASDTSIRSMIIYLISTLR